MSTKGIDTAKLVAIASTLQRRVQNMADYQRALAVEVVEMIRTEVMRGDGVEDPYRRVSQYWRKDGTLIGEIDVATGRNGQGA